MENSGWIIIIFCFVWILFNKKIEKYLSGKIKSRLSAQIPSAKIEKLQKENSIYKRENNKQAAQTKTTIQPTVFKPAISKALIAINFIFIVFGIIFTIIATKDKFSVPNLFPLIFIIYGTIMLLKIYSTKYQLDDCKIQITDVFNKFEIMYEDIIEVEKRKINLAFRHGKKGRIRSETSSETIFITTSKPISNQKYTIIISPKNDVYFIDLLTRKLLEQ